MKSTIYASEVRITYKIENTDELIELNASSYEDTTFNISILDKEMDKRTGETTVTFGSIKELRDILTDFENKLKALKIKK